MVREFGETMTEMTVSQPWLRKFQENQYQKCLRRGLPTRKEENWKYTALPFATLESYSTPVKKPHPTSLQKCEKSGFMRLVFIDGYYCPELSNIENLPDSVTLSTLSSALLTQAEKLKPYLTKEFDVQRYPFAVLNSARMTEGVYLHVPKHVSIVEPIHLIYMNTQPDKIMICPRNIILADEGAEISLIEEYLSESGQHFTNAVTEVHVKNNAHVSVYKIQDESYASLHMGSTFVHQHKDSRLNLFVVSKGAELSREEVFVDLAASGAESHLLGLYTLSQDNQHTDHHLHVDHAAAHGTSTMLYKGILDKKSKAVFNGKVVVHPHAQQTNSSQTNHTLLLSNDAEVNTKPELEIYADDVKCTHGATVGQLDMESLFYLRSRGMDKDTALRTLLGAFACEVIGKISNEKIRQYIQSRVENYVEL